MVFTLCNMWWMVSTHYWHWKLHVGEKISRIWDMCSLNSTPLAAQTLGGYWSISTLITIPPTLEETEE